MQRRCRWRDQRAEAEDRHRGCHRELVLAREDADVIAIEADNHAAVDRDAEVDEALDFLEQILLQVLPLLRLAQAGLVRRLDADEHMR